MRDTKNEDTKFSRLIFDSDYWFNEVISTRKLAIIGTQLGDEGKGKVTDFFSKYYDYVVRWQGGRNAGHTVMVNGTKTHVNQLPSAIFYKDKKIVLARGMGINMRGLLAETLRINRKIYNEKYDIRQNLYISRHAHIVFDWYKDIDKKLEQFKEHVYNDPNMTVKTTGQGMSPAYAHKHYRIGCRIEDLMYPTEFKAKLKILSEHAKLFGVDIDIDDVYKSHMVAFDFFKDNIVNTDILLQKADDNGSRILFEGAQSVLLDTDYGQYPFVSSSQSSPLSLSLGTGLNHKRLADLKILGVGRLYIIRSGNGPMPTELSGDELHELRRLGNEYGVVTGRPRRLGWIDLPALEYAIDLGGVDWLVFTKFDVLDHFDKIPVCIGYEKDGIKYLSYVDDPYFMAQAKPIYQYFDGWSKPSKGVEDYRDLPEELLEVIRYISFKTKCPIIAITNGPNRNDIVFLGKDVYERKSRLLEYATADMEFDRQ